MLRSMAIVERALGGSSARKLRAVLPDLPLNGEKVALTEVIYLVSIFDTVKEDWRFLHTDVSKLERCLVVVDWLALRRKRECCLTHSGPALLLPCLDLHYMAAFGTHSSSGCFRSTTWPHARLASHPAS